MKTFYHLDQGEQMRETLRAEFGVQDFDDLKVAYLVHGGALCVSHLDRERGVVPTCTLKAGAGQEAAKAFKRLKSLYGRPERVVLEAFFDD